MSGLELIASIVAVAGTGAKLAIGFYDICNDLGSAGRSAHALATEIRMLSHLFSILSSIPEQDDTELLRDAHKLARDLVALCEEEMESMRQLLGSLCRISSREQLSSVTFVERVQFLFRKSKLRFHKTALEALKNDILLLLSSLRYAAAIDAKATSRDL